MSKGRTLRLRVRREDDLIFTEKPSGFNTHASDVGRTGWVELLQEELGQPLFVVQRLDSGTSGALVFATSSSAAAELSALFESRVVKKKYLFVTAQKTALKDAEMRSFIERRGSSFVSDRKRPPNATTKFRFVRSTKLGDVWEAAPETGKPHQIRLHAQDLGLPILGDDAHGGAPFGRLCLHAKSLEFPWRGTTLSFEAATPAWTGDSEPSHALIFDAVQARSMMFELPAHPDECLRLVHTESNLCDIDQYGPQLVTSWYADRAPSAADLQALETIAQGLSKSMVVRLMQNKGRDPLTKTTWTLGNAQTRWTARENGVAFELRTDTGQSPGLFLDQRENRLWVREHSQDKKVLNLFAYTGGFSVNAALGGASEVTTVDLSGVFNTWTGDNMRLNGLDPEGERFEFWSQDCLLFLRGALKRRRHWDLIICDPPSFGRSKEGVFQIHKNLPELLELTLGVLAPGGRLLLSTNYERWTMADLQRQVVAGRRPQDIKIEPVPRAGPDFEKPDHEPLMKSLLIHKK